ncbi:MAG: PQQ-binding-like beta-propeller repeat protein [Desulfobacterales bacterium]
MAVDLETGKIIHDIKVFDVAEPQVRNPGLNTHATPTPVVEDGRVYVHYGAYGTACLDTKTGKKLWERRDLNTNHEVRAGSSPIVDDDTIYLHFDGTDKQFVAALDKRTGKTRWLKKRDVDYDLDGKLSALGFSKAEIESTKKKKPGDNRKSFATPTLITYQGKRQLISPGAEVTFSYDPDTGAELWRVRHPGMGWNVAARPIFENGLVYSSSGVSRHLMAVQPSGTGDVTDTHVNWMVKGKDAPAIPSALIVNDLIFLITDEGFASCREAKTGRRLWRKRLRAGGGHWASPVYADGKIYFSGQKGVVTVVAAAREFKLLAENKFDGSFNASPAVVGDGLILRSFTDLYYIAR